MGAQPPDQRERYARGGVAVSHDAAEDRAGGKQQEKLSGESEGAQGPERKILGYPLGHRKAIGDNDQQGAQYRRQDDIHPPQGEPDE